jgi:hypothetical protein
MTRDKNTSDGGVATGMGGRTALRRKRVRTPDTRETVVVSRLAHDGCLLVAAWLPAQGIEDTDAYFARSKCQVTPQVVVDYRRALESSHSILTSTVVHRFSSKRTA